MLQSAKGCLPSTPINRALPIEMKQETTPSDPCPQQPCVKTSNRNSLNSSDQYLSKVHYFSLSRYSISNFKPRSWRSWQSAHFWIAMSSMVLHSCEQLSSSVVVGLSSRIFFLRRIQAWQYLVRLDQIQDSISDNAILLNCFVNLLAVPTICLFWGRLTKAIRI